MTVSEIQSIFLNPPEILNVVLCLFTDKTNSHCMLHYQVIHYWTININLPIITGKMM